MRGGAEVVREDRVLAVLAVARVAGSPPCRRHGYCSRQYQQRVAWSRLPPIVPMARSCGEAARRHASRSASGISGRPRARRASCRRRSSVPSHAARHDLAHVDERLGLRRSRRAAAARARCRRRARGSAPLRPSAATSVERARPHQLATRSSLSCLAQRPQHLLARDRQRATSAPVASRIAFAIAAAVGTIGGSPSPFEPRFVRCASGIVDELGRRSRGRRRSSAACTRRACA